MEKQLLEAVKWAKERLKKPRRKKTIEEYKRVIKRLVGKKSKKEFASNKNTRGLERASIRFHFAYLILKYANSDPETSLFYYNDIKEMALEAEERRKRYLSGKDPLKRPSLRGLGRDWRERLIQFASESKHVEGMRIMAITGCRPAEYEKGVEVTRNHSENSIEFKIYGAKCSDFTKGGQEWRILVFDVNHPLIGNLQSGIYKAKQRQVQKAIVHFGKKIRKSIKNPISAYSLRHAAASDFKASRLSKPEQSAALGHQSTATLGLYGSKSRGPGLLNLISVSAASPVRTPIKKPRKKPRNKPKL